MKQQYFNRWSIEKELDLSSELLDKIINIMKQHHPNQNWIYVRCASNNQKTIYLSSEGVNWIKNVFLDDGKSFLDRDIKFFESLIKELDISKKYFPIKYEDMNVKQLQNYFNKTRESVYVAIHQMVKQIGNYYKYEKDNIITIQAEGVKWLNEKYYRKSYLKVLEEIKLKIEKGEYNE